MKYASENKRSENDMSGFCRWHGKGMENVTEHEQEQCKENDQYCLDCPDLVAKKQEEEHE